MKPINVNLPTQPLQFNALPTAEIAENMTMLNMRQITSSQQIPLRDGDSRAMVLPLTPSKRCQLTWIEVSLAALMITLGLLSAGRTASAESPLASPLAGQAVYLPMISAADVAAANLTCDLNDEEAAIFQMMKADPKQGRDEARCNPILAKVARARAKDMATRQYFDHVDPDGHGPNYLVLAAGYRLPDWYDRSERANNIESIGGGFQDAASMWRAWLGSEYHRIHVLGSISFYADQEEVGVGYYYDENSPYGKYWVVLSAPKE